MKIVGLAKEPKNGLFRARWAEPGGLIEKKRKTLLDNYLRYLHDNFETN